MTLNKISVGNALSKAHTFSHYKSLRSS